MMWAVRTIAFLVISGVASAALAQDAARGEAVFGKCATCHSVGDDAENRTGPILTGVIGRRAASVEGFDYGDDMIAAGQAGLVWTEELIFDYIADPRTFLRTFLDDRRARAKMTFRLRDEADRRDVIAFLATFTTAALATPAVCVRNASDERHFFAAEVTGIVRTTGWLEPGDELCAPAGDPAAPGFVSVFETDEGFEGCSRLVSAGKSEDMIRYADFDRCAWGSNSG